MFKNKFFEAEEGKLNGEYYDEMLFFQEKD